MATKTWIGGASPLNDWSVAAGWSPSGVPINGDVVWLDGAVNNEDITAGLAQSGVTLAELWITKSWTGKLGTASAYLAIEATLVNIGVPSGASTENGSQRIKINLGSVVSTVTVQGSSSTSADTGLEPVRLLGTHAGNTLYVTGGKVGVATTTQLEVSTFLAINQQSASSGAKSALNLGSGCTLTALELGGGDMVNRGSNVTTLTQLGGEYWAYGSPTHGTIDCDGGTCNYLSDGTITTLRLSGEFTSARDPRPKTITNATLYEGATLDLDTGNPLSVTVTNGIDLVRCGIEDVTLRRGKHLSLAASAI